MGLIIKSIKTAYKALVFVQAALSTCMHTSGPLGPNLSQNERQANILNEGLRAQQGGHF